jgi:hypothetical protein
VTECATRLEHMPALDLTRFLRGIRRTNGVDAVMNVSREIVEHFPDDEAMPRLTCIVAAKSARFVRATRRPLARRAPQIASLARFV